MVWTDQIHCDMVHRYPTNHQITLRSAMAKGGLRKPYTIKDNCAKLEHNQQGKNDFAIVIENINSNGHKSLKISTQNQQIRFGNIPSPIVWITRPITTEYRFKNLHLFCISSNACLTICIDSKLTTSLKMDSNQSNV